VRESSIQLQEARINSQNEINARSYGERLLSLIKGKGGGLSNQAVLPFIRKASQAQENPPKQRIFLNGKS
jgi:hypothetical protein